MFRKYAFCGFLRGNFSFYANKMQGMYENVVNYGFKYAFCYCIWIKTYKKRYLIMY